MLRAGKYNTSIGLSVELCWKVGRKIQRKPMRTNPCRSIPGRGVSHHAHHVDNDRCRAAAQITPIPLAPPEHRSEHSGGPYRRFRLRSGADLCLDAGEVLTPNSKIQAKAKRLKSSLRERLSTCLETGKRQAMALDTSPTKAETSRESCDESPRESIRCHQVARNFAKRQLRSVCQGSEVSVPSLVQ